MGQSAFGGDYFDPFPARQIAAEIQARPPFGILGFEHFEQLRPGHTGGVDIEMYCTLSHDVYSLSIPPPVYLN
jgi:hypothetical protein